MNFVVSVDKVLFMAIAQYAQCVALIKGTTGKASRVMGMKQTHRYAAIVANGGRYNGSNMFVHW